MPTPIILFGGLSDERLVSVASAQNLARSLDTPLCWFQAPNAAVHDVSVAELVAHQRPFENDYAPSRPAIWPDLEQALDTLPVDEPVFVLALHGGEGEDGTVQRMLEDRGIPFTGSGSVASAAALDKGRATEIVCGRVRVPESRAANAAAELERTAREMLVHHERIVLKPLAGGSSRGLYFLGRNDAAGDILGRAAANGTPYFVEQFVAGRELTVGVLDRGAGAFALPVLEIEMDPGFTFDYDGKYLGKGTREICPAQIPDDMRRETQRAAEIAHEALGCHGYSRSDFVAGPDGVYFLELNTLPGQTISSLFPQELREIGMTLREFIEEQIELAALRASSKRR